MGKALIITEKPSVANDIARALGGFKKHNDYFESEEYVLASALGHLLEITPPEAVEVKGGKWSLKNLPVIPSNFELKPIGKTESRLKLLQRLVKRKDVDLLINACDAGREGELIFRYLVRYLQTKKPIRRLWLQSMTPSAIRDGFRQLRADEDLWPLADAATCRSEADWLVGINSTRAMTAFNSKTGGFQLTPVGRVQTPTLTIVVQREEAIRKFVPRDYWEVHATFEARSGSYQGRWFDETFSRKKEKEKEGDSEQRPERLWDREKAEAIKAKCEGQIGEVTEETKPSTQMPPLLYDLTSLQRDAYSRMGISASNTLKTAQALYERHKVITYPRTDSRALPEDYTNTVQKTLTTLTETQYAEFAREILQQEWVKPNKRIFNNAKVSDHFAIIPTTLQPPGLNDLEARLYDLIVKRFLAIFYPAAEYLLTTRITRVQGEPFKTEGKVLVKAGWLKVYGRQAQAADQSQSDSGDEPARLPPVEANEQVQTSDIEVMAKQTKPPPRFTEATLLTAMEGAGKLVEDDELREAMREKGLGTPATRAAIIEGLLDERYLQRSGRELIPTAKAFSLITLLRALNIPGLNSPELTGNWEYKLNQMERGRLKRPDFMQEIEQMTQEIVDKTKRYESDTVPGDFGTLREPCPKCGGTVKETYKTFQCESCELSTWKILAGRQFELEEMEQLLREGQLGPLQGFRSKAGKPFNAVIRLTPEYKLEFDFGQNENRQSEAVDFSGQEPIGSCPQCGGSIYEGTMSYLCEKAAGPEKQCDFSMGKIILQRPIEREQVAKLLTHKKTDLLQKFISKRGRPFSAYLVVDQRGKVGFEFEPKKRPSKKTGKTASKKTTSTVQAESKGGSSKAS